MKFTWDPIKAERNLITHKVSFAEAEKVFDDPFALEFEDDRFRYDEVRMIIIGMAVDDVLTVVYAAYDAGAVSDEETIRIISARRATSTERKHYHEHPRC